MTRSVLNARRRCPDCDSKDLYWFTSSQAPDVPEGRLRTSEVRHLLVLGCNYCSATVDIFSGDDAARDLTKNLVEQNKKEEQARQYMLNPNIREITDLVSDEEMGKSFAGTNFGHTDYRGLLAQGCIKALAGWHQGHTLTTILAELALIDWNRETGTITVTDKGQHYIWLAFKNRPGETCA